MGYRLSMIMIAIVLVGESTTSEPRPVGLYLSTRLLLWYCRLSSSCLCSPLSRVMTLRHHSPAKTQCRPGIRLYGVLQIEMDTITEMSMVICFSYWGQVMYTLIWTQDYNFTDRQLLQNDKRIQSYDLNQQQRNCALHNYTRKKNNSN